MSEKDMSSVASLPAEASAKAGAKGEVIYELAYLLRVGESEKVLDEVLTAHGAVVKHKSALSSIQLAYPIKKQGVGQFGYYHLTFSNPDSVKAVSDTLQLKESVLRFLMVKVPKTKPRVLPQAEVRPVTSAAAKSIASPAKPIDRIDTLSNERLSQTLEEILK